VCINYQNIILRTLYAQVLSIVFKASLKRRLSVRAHREDKASRRLEIRRKATVSNKKARREGRRRQGGANPAATARDLASVA
jgi:hypothetical protein